MEGDFTANRLSGLPPEHLQFIQLFIHCEGSIREMEKALGVSYPTVKARLAAVKAALEIPMPAKAKKPAKSDVASVLTALQNGDLNYDEALKQIRKLKQGE